MFVNEHSNFEIGKMLKEVLGMKCGEVNMMENMSNQS